jgi:hypothetical protein
MKMHDVDRVLRGELGLIRRGFDKNYCRHARNGRCDHCMDIEVCVE